MYEYIIIGGGSAGCVLAAPDTGAFIRVPLGVVHLMMSKKLNWQYFTQPPAALDGRVQLAPPNFMARSVWRCSWRHRIGDRSS